MRRFERIEPGVAVFSRLRRSDNRSASLQFYANTRDGPVGRIDYRNIEAVCSALPKQKQGNQYGEWHQIGIRL
ncbi:MAG: hypothetical protein ABSC05_00400 [Candidatus Solibacter sp.]